MASTRGFVVKYNGLFWSGHGWVSEYPNAVVYPIRIQQTEVDRAFRAAEALRDAAGADSGVELEGIHNYGTDQEDRFAIVPSWDDRTWR